MSQHYFPALYKGKAVEVLIGWDRPMSQFFLVIELLDFDEGDDEENDDNKDDDEILYSNLNDPLLRVNNGNEKDLGYFRGVLDKYEIQLPEQLWTQLASDQRNNLGNSKTNWNPDGTKSSD